jgi:hypothetical protein
MFTPWQSNKAMGNMGNPFKLGGIQKAGKIGKSGRITRDFFWMNRMTPRLFTSLE